MQFIHYPIFIENKMLYTVRIGSYSLLFTKLFIEIVIEALYVAI